MADISLEDTAVSTGSTSSLTLSLLSDDDAYHVIMVGNDSTGSSISWSNDGTGWSEEIKFGNSSIAVHGVCFLKYGNTDTGNITVTASSSADMYAMYLVVTYGTGSAATPVSGSSVGTSSGTTTGTIVHSVDDGVAFCGMHLMDGADILAGSLFDIDNLASGAGYSRPKRASPDGSTSATALGVGMLYGRSPNGAFAGSNVTVEGTTAVGDGQGAMFITFDEIPAGPDFERDGIAGADISDVDGIASADIAEVDGVTA